MSADSDFSDSEKPRNSNKKAKSKTLRVHNKWERALFIQRLQSDPQVPEVEFVSADSPLRTLNESSNSLSGHFQPDFEIENGPSVVIITEPEYVGNCNLYRRRLAKFFSSKTAADLIVICVRSQQTPLEDFTAVQTFAVIELGLAFIPVSDNLERHLPQLIVQLICVQKRKNPFKLGVKPTTKPGPLGEVLTTLQAIPGLGEKKGRILLEKFGSIKAISQASNQELSKAVGPTSAQSVSSFFKA